MFECTEISSATAIPQLKPLVYRAHIRRLIRCKAGLHPHSNMRCRQRQLERWLITCSLIHNMIRFHNVPKVCFISFPSIWSVNRSSYSYLLTVTLIALLDIFAIVSYSYLLITIKDSIQFEFDVNKFPRNYTPFHQKTRLIIFHAEQTNIPPHDHSHPPLQHSLGSH